MAGQSASLTVTLSGQIISEGFIEWHTTPWKRRLVTRLIGIIPSLAVAVSVGRQGIDVLLVGSQVALSIVSALIIGMHPESRADPRAPTRSSLSSFLRPWRFLIPDEFR